MTFLALSSVSCEKGIDDDDSGSLPTNPYFGAYTWTWSDIFLDGKKFIGYNPAQQGESWYLTLNEDMTFSESYGGESANGTFTWDSNNAQLIFNYIRGGGFFPGEKLDVKSWTKSKLVVVYDHGQDETGKTAVEHAHLTK